MKRKRRNWRESQALCTLVRAVRRALPNATQLEIAGRLQIPRPLVTYYLKPECAAATRSQPPEWEKEIMTAAFAIAAKKPIPAAKELRRIADILEGIKPMKSTTYKITLSDGTAADVQAHSAGEAIEKARRDYRGRTVVFCRSGLTEAEAENLRTTADKNAMAGIINYEIPPHDPIPAEAVVQSERRGTPPDCTTPFPFDAQFPKQSRGRGKDRG